MINQKIITNDELPPWRPIETIPKDGSFVDVLIAGKRYPNYRYEAYLNKWECVNVWDKSTRIFVDLDQAATAWMPAPELPRGGSLCPWLPIDTIPNDGTLVDAFIYGSRYPNCKYDAFLDCWKYLNVLDGTTRVFLIFERDAVAWLPVPMIPDA